MTKDYSDRIDTNNYVIEEFRQYSPDKSKILSYVTILEFGKMVSRITRVYKNTGREIKSYSCLTNHLSNLEDDKNFNEAVNYLKSQLNLPRTMQKRWKKVMDSATIL